MLLRLQDDRSPAARFFQHSQDTMVWSCLQGHMGSAWVSGRGVPGAARVVNGSFAFFAGDAGCPEARELVEDLPWPAGDFEFILVPETPRWNGLIKEVWGGRGEPIRRYAIRKDPVFDTGRLAGFVRRAEEAGFAVAPIAGPLYEAVRREKWSRDFVSQFSSREDYARRGLGFAALWDGAPVAGASSYLVFDGGLEIEVDTREDFQRRGLAAACAARLILASLERGIAPCWDAANLASAALSEKLGYRPDRPYDAFLVPHIEMRG